MDRIAAAPAPAVLPLAAPGWTLSGVGASGLAAASTVLLLLYLTGRLLWVYNKEAAASAAEAPGAASSSSSSPAGNSLPATPPRRAVLPVLVHMGAGIAPPECAVCLSEVVAPREAGRLLPGCGHGFHEECIATWLRLNATCPLCRANVTK